MTFHVHITRETRHSFMHYLPDVFSRPKCSMNPINKLLTPTPVGYSRLFHQLQATIIGQDRRDNEVSDKSASVSDEALISELIRNIVEFLRDRIGNRSTSNHFGHQWKSNMARPRNDYRDKALIQGIHQNQSAASRVHPSWSRHRNSVRHLPEICI